MRLGAAILIALVVLGRGQGALAHSPPLGTGLWWVPPSNAATGSPPGERLIIRTPRGLLLESPATGDFRFLCNEALAIADGEEASFADVKGDVLLMSTWANGVMRGSADGCNWAPVTEAMMKPAFDVVVSGTDAEATAYVVGGKSNAGDHFWAGRDAGTGWSTLANSDIPYTRVRVAPSNPSRLYVTGIGMSTMATAVHRLGVSDDGGRTIVDRILDLGPQDLQARVLAVNPLNPEHLYLYVESVSAEIPERILVSQDGGQSFTNGATLHDIHGFAQSVDGGRVWVGGKEGIYRSIDGGGVFSSGPSTAMTNVTCLAFHQDQLYACGVLDNQLVVAVSNDGGDSFRKVLTFDQVTRSLDCPMLDPATSPAVTCATALSHWRYEFGTLYPATGGTGGSDGSGGSGGSSGSPPGPVPPAAGCAIGVGDHGLAGTSTIAPVLAALALSRLRGRWLRRQQPGRRVIE